MFKTPQFWLTYSWISWLFLPFTFLYKIAFNIKKNFTKTHQVKIPIICVGNIIAGGSGKTPFAIALGKYLKNNGVNFCYLTRGYKSKNNSVKYLDNIKKYSALEVGDEPILLSEVAPVFVAKNRWHGYQEIAKNSEFKAIIMDDGLQNFQLQKSIKILVIDSKIAFGNNLLLPSGPMRQKLEDVIDEIDLFVFIGNNNQNISTQILNKKPNAQIISTKVIIKNLDNFKDKKLIAFCGIAYPQKFFNLIIDSGANLFETHSFSDHHNYKSDELEKLIYKAKQNNCHLITTKKDWVKFSKSVQKTIDYVDIGLDIELENYDDKILRNLFEKYF